MLFSSFRTSHILRVSLLLATAITVSGQSMVFGQTIDLTPKKSGQCFVSAEVPDGNYRVTVTIGDKKRDGHTTVRAENRRLMLENLKTKAGKDTVCTFVVNKRNRYYGEGDVKEVKLKSEENDYFTWDDLLTLEITGHAPAVKSIVVEPDTSATTTTVYLCGNSTVVDQYYEPWSSWGQMIPRWFDDEVAIANYAHSGLSTESFIAQGRLDKICERLCPGDWVFVEFGHNDQKETFPGAGAYYNFAHNLKKFIDLTRAKGANIVFCTPTQRRFWMDDNATIKETHGDYPQAMVEVAMRENVPVIDLHQMTREMFETLGFEDSKKTLVHYRANTFPDQPKDLADNTHFNPYGAYQIAKMVAQTIIDLDLPLKAHIRPEFKGYDPKQPDAFDSFDWQPSVINSAKAKPAGN